MAYVWNPKKRGDQDTIQEENDVIEPQEELTNVEKELRQGKDNCLVMRTERLIAYEIH